MPLRKLWNSIRGRSTPTGNGCDDPAGSANRAKPEPPKSKEKPKRGLFGGGPHAGLRKLLKTVEADTVLEISVGDGSRAIAILETLAKQNQKPRYIAIDQFEMADGEVTLKEFHQTLRAHEIRPQVFPQDIENGLTRVAHTVGATDLIIIGADPSVWQTPIIGAKLARISHNGTVILYLSAEGWKKHTLAEPAEIRRAA